MAVTNPDVELLFGVLGGGSVSGASGTTISGQLAELVKGLNKNPLKIKIGVDTEGSRQIWGKQIQDALNSISKSGNLSIQISEIQLSADAVERFRKQIGSIINTTGLSSAVGIPVSLRGTTEAANALKTVQTALGSTGSSAAEASSKISTIGDSAERTTSKLREMSDAASKSTAMSPVGTMEDNIKKAQVSLQSFADTFTQMQNLWTNNLWMEDSPQFEALRENTELFRKVLLECGLDAERFKEVLREAGIDGAKAIKEARDSMSVFKAEIANAEAETSSRSPYKKAMDAVKEYYKLLASMSKTGGDVTQTNNGFQSASGKYKELAAALNLVRTRYAELTSETAKSQMSQTQIEVLESEIAKKERELSLAIEARAASQKKAAKSDTAEIAAFKVQAEALTRLKNTVSGSLSRLERTATTDEESARIRKVSAEYDLWAEKIKKVLLDKAKISPEYRAELEAEGRAISDSITQLREQRAALEEVTRAKENAAASKTINKNPEDTEKDIADQKTRNALVQQYLTLLSQMQKVIKNSSAANSGKTRDDYQWIVNNAAALDTLGKQFRQTGKDAEKFRAFLQKTKTEFAQHNAVIKENGKNVKTFGERMAGLAQKFSMWFSATHIIMSVVRAIRRMISASIELDNAMTQLEVVTRDTSDAYDEYLNKITKTAEKIGASIPDLIDSTTTFARLGYSLEESKSLAEFTSMLKNVGDIDVSDAQNAITAIIKAFGVSVGEIESVMDKLVATGNKFPISVSQIAEGMNNASSALASAGNTFDQSVALLTAANTTIQNAAKSSTGLRTIAARLRSTKTELDELGESMTEAEYETLVSSLTKYNVALTDQNEEFRSTYDILADIAAVWNNLSSMEQAALANAIAGVRQQSVFYSIVEQFQGASGAMDAMANSAGTLQESYAVVMDSTAAHVNQFKAAFQSLGKTLFPDSFLSNMADIGTFLLKILESVAKLANVVGGLNTALFVTAGIVATIKLDAIGAFLGSILTGVEALFGWFSKLGTAMIGFVRVMLATAKGATVRNTVGAWGVPVIKEFTVALNAAGIAATSAQAAIGSLFAVVGVVMLVSSHMKKAREETIKMADATIQETKAEIDRIDTLKESYAAYKKYAEQQSRTAEEEAEFNNTIENITKALGEKKSALDGLTAGTKEYTEKLEEQIKAELRAQEIAARQRSHAAKQKLESESQNWLKDSQISVVIDDKSKIDPETYETINKIMGELAQITGLDRVSGGPFGLKIEPSDLQDMDSVVDYYYKLLELKDALAESDLMDADGVYDSITDITGKIGAAVKEYVQAEYDYAYITYENMYGIVDTFDEFIALRDYMYEQLGGKFSFGGLFGSIDSFLAGINPAFAGFLKDAPAKENGSFVETASTALASIENLQSAYKLLETAQEEMAEGRGLSADTVKALSEAERDFIQYIYEENGVLKLNTEAWKANADAKIQGKLNDAKNNLADLKETNAQLRADLENYEQQRSAGNDGGIWSRQIAETTSQLAKNEEAIRSQEKEIAVLEASIRSVTASYTELQSVLSNLSTIYKNVGKLSDALGSFKENGFADSSELFELSKLFGNLDSFESFVNIMGDSSSSMDDAQNACNNLMSEYIRMSGILDGVSESTANIIELKLEEMGVLNAHELVQTRLNSVRLEGILAAESLSDAVWDTAEQFLKESGASETAISSLKRLRQEQYNAKLAATNLKDASLDTIEALLTQARAAGIVAESIAALAQAQSLKDRYESGELKNSRYWMNNDSNSGVSRYEAKLNELAEKARADLSDFGSVTVPQVKVSLPESSSKKGKSTKEVEAYTAAIDEFRVELERLRKTQEDAERLESEIENAGGYEKKIALQKELSAAYREEQDALLALNRARANAISRDIGSLRKLGFDIEYNAETNDLWISNLERLNELEAPDKGKYDSIQEATNALRKDTEELIGTITELNDSNREGSVTWQELNRSIIETTVSMYENAIQARETAITRAENSMSNAIAAKNLADVKAFSSAIISGYQGMQKTVHEQAEYYRSIGYSETSDELSKLGDLWWDYAENIKNVKQQVVDYLIGIADASHNSVDEIQNASDTLYKAADEFAENNGFISIDTYQEILKLGPQYMQMLKDENGVLQINRERINEVLAARIKQMAAENAMAYVERLKLAVQKGSVENLNELLYATKESTNATFGLAYAELELMHSLGELNDKQYEAALHNIQAIESLSNTAIESVGRVAGEFGEKTKEELNNMKSGLDDILKYVMDMLKHKIQQQVEALEDMKDAYGDIIDLRKEALDVAKNEADYEDKVAEKVKAIAKLQERINALSLDDSRDAQTQKMKLEEELAELQKELADDQNNHAVDAQKDALDDMQDAYEKEKDAEIKALEDTISSYQKLYDMAIDYIQDNWDALYQELLSWNSEYGSVLNSEITNAWDNCLAAAERYGDYVSALTHIDADIKSAETNSGNKNNTAIGNMSNQTQPTREETISRIITRMYENGQAWGSASSEEKQKLADSSLRLGIRLKEECGIQAKRDENGVWHDEADGALLFEKYKKYIYHNGGIAGNNPTLKQNEIMAVLEKGEAVLDEQKERGLYRLIEFATTLSDKFSDLIRSSNMKNALVGTGGIANMKPDVPHNITNNESVTIEFGNTIIYGANNETVEKHRAITRQQANELFDKLNIKR